MKMLIGGIAAAFLASVAVAQTPPADPMASNPAATPPATPTPADAAPSATTETAEAPMLVEKDGKWWNGEREATPAEIAEYNRNKPQ